MSAPIYAAFEFGASRETDADSRIMKMKEGSTHLARYFVLKHKAENAVDLDKGVILAAEITPGHIAYVPSMSLRPFLIASSWVSSAKALATTAVSKTPKNKNPKKGSLRWFIICHFPSSWSWSKRWAHAAGKSR